MALNLLTGSTGFVGEHVVEYLFQQNEISKGTFGKGSRLKTLDINGVIWSRTSFPRYTAEQLRASLRIGPKASWEPIGYSPKYDLEKTCEDVTLWNRREPWIAKPA